MFKDVQRNSVVAGTDYCEVICEGERKVTFSKKGKEKKKQWEV